MCSCCESECLAEPKEGGTAPLEGSRRVNMNRSVFKGSL